MSGFVPEERGQGALCNHGETDYTSNAYFGVARADHTDLFSCEWFTFSQPCISPFLPIYIGINKLPKAMSTRELFDLFDKLRLAVEWHPEYRADITKYWTVFEIQAIEQSHLLEHKVARLADKGDLEGARRLLTEFVERKSDEAKKAGQNILQFLNDLPMFGGVSGASPPWNSK
jgi:dipeptidase